MTAGEVVVLVPIHGHGGESAVLALPVEEIEVADRGLGLAGVALVDGDQLTGLRVRERVEEDTVHHREERGVGTDTESEGGDGDDRKGGRLEEHAEGEADVLSESDHGQPRGWDV